MQENKKKILESSIKVFSEKGIYQATLADVAAAAGISKGTLFYYYRSKNDLLYDILDISIREITELVARVLQEGEGEISKELFVLIFRSLLKYDFLMKINYYLVQEALLDNKTFAEKFRDKYENWRQDIRSALGKIRVNLSPAAKDARAAILLAAIDGLCLQYLLEPEALDLDAVCTELVKMFQ